jgi:myo-inositol-1(or 4)-monophosphatase
MWAELERLRAIVSHAAEQELLPRFAAVERGRKADGSLVTEADLAMQQRMQDALAKYWPAYRLLGEETEEQCKRQLLADDTAPMWCLDPLDGTTNFTAGVPFFSVSLALLSGGEPVLGVVYDPMRRECFMTQKGQGAWLDGTRLVPKRFGLRLTQCIALVDLKRLKPALACRLAQKPPYSSQRSFGSVALDWAWLAAGRVHVYLHGGQKLWDYAAGSLILQEAGGHAVSLEGEPLGYQAAQPRSVVAALDSDLFQEWRAWIGI